MRPQRTPSYHNRTPPPRCPPICTAIPTPHRHTNTPTVIPAQAGIQHRHSNIPPVIPTQAGIQHRHPDTPSLSQHPTRHSDASRNPASPFQHPNRHSGASRNPASPSPTMVTEPVPIDSGASRNDGKSPTRHYTNPTHLVACTQPTPQPPSEVTPLCPKTTTPKTQTPSA